MAKVLLVEDDNNLREIFEMRLQAEGYQTVTASDGEQGLSVAMKEKPDLIIADVMMPKLSGFEMLETLRSSPEMKSVKVVMMTALGAAEDVARGEKLGVNKYLVKSQVTLEDFVRVVREVLAPDQTAQSGSQANQGQNLAGQPPSSMPATPINDTSGQTSSSGSQMTSAQESSNIQSKINDFTATATSPGSQQQTMPSSSSGQVNIPVNNPPPSDQAATDSTASTPPA